MLTNIFNFQENCAYATIGGTCFTKKTQVELYMRLERNVWKLGEKIPVHVECSVKGGSTKVDKVSLLCINKLGNNKLANCNIIMEKQFLTS